MKVSVNKIEIAYTEQGSGPPLLFVHGYPLSRQMWQPQISSLSRSNHLWIPDLRGFGESTPAPTPYSMDLFADDLAKFMEGLNITQPVVLCGHSMGGYIAMAFARNYPERLNKLVLVSTRAAPDTQEGRLGRDRAVQSARENGVEVIIETMAPKLLAPQNLLERPKLVDEVKSVMHPSLQGVLGSLAGMRDRPDSRPFLHQIRVPTLIIHGANDQLIPVSEAEAMAEAISGAIFAIIQNAGHLPNLEQPDLFNTTLGDFLLA